jgi:hypothetical protein
MKTFTDARLRRVLALLSVLFVLAQSAAAFVDANAGFPPIFYSSAAWGDFDNDGRLDLLLTGVTNGASATSRLWRNTGSGFTNMPASYTPGLPQFYKGSAVWVDYNNDGWLDFMISGAMSGGNAAQLWRNTGNGFTNVTATVMPGLPAAWLGAIAWADYDNDGRQDFLLTGFDNGQVTQLWHNNGGTFSNVTSNAVPGIAQVYLSSVAWGDYDNDGWMDFFIAGVGNSGRISQIWRNNGNGTFTEVTATIALNLSNSQRVGASTAVWGDYDNDGRLDLLLGGEKFSDASDVAQIWRNTGTIFTNVTTTVAPGLPGVGLYSSAAWGDYDNDGWLDFLITGASETNRISQLWRNTGGAFSNMTSTALPSLPQLKEGPMAWADYDNDGRLDFLLGGTTNETIGITQLWRNTEPQTNTPPTAPTGLTASVNNGHVNLSWNASTDAQTTNISLSYNLRVGTTPGGADIVNPAANLTNGFRRVAAMGNVQLGTNAVLTNLALGTYYWSVQAVDSAFAGSPFSATNSFFYATPPSITGISRQPNGSLLFQFSGTANANYRLEFSTNLPQWFETNLLTAGSNGVFQFTDSQNTNSPARFYRLKTLP